MSKVHFPNGIVLAVASLICLLFLKAYVLYEEEKLAAAERRRIQCLDNFCEGDVYPKFDYLNEWVVKINGQWYVGPKNTLFSKVLPNFFGRLSSVVPLAVLMTRVSGTWWKYFLPDVSDGQTQRYPSRGWGRVGMGYSKKYSKKAGAIWTISKSALAWSE